MNFDTILVIFFSAMILYAAFRYEREDLGCESCWDTNIGACSDYNSVYVKDTECGKHDGPRDIKKKLMKLLNFDEAAGTWKRCVLWSFMLACLGYVMYSKGGCIDDTNIVNKHWLFVISWLVFATVLYLLKSFESVHIYRIIKKNGSKLCDRLYKHAISSA